VNLFDFKSHRIRVTLIDGEPWFVAADVCRALGMDTSRGTYQWVRHLDEDERKSIARENYPQIFRGFRGGALTLISESGLYALILRSNKPEAKEFSRWVRKEVLPAIRKTGGCMLKGADREKIAEGTTKEFRLPKDFADALELARQTAPARTVGGEGRRYAGFGPEFRHSAAPMQRPIADFSGGSESHVATGHCAVVTVTATLRRKPLPPPVYR